MDDNNDSRDNNNNSTDNSTDNVNDSTDNDNNLRTMTTTLWTTMDYLDVFLLSNWDSGTDTTID